jgi:hypothetical protein
LRADRLGPANSQAPRMQSCWNDSSDGPRFRLTHDAPKRQQQSAILSLYMDFKNLNPDIFLQPPFEPCPFCSYEEFGVWTVEGRTCTRTCRRCQYHEGRTLRPITKRLIYLDQFAITNILHAYRPETRRSPGRKVDPFWIDLAERIFHLGAWQFLACPHTLIHLEESILDDRIFRYLQRIYNYLGFGVSVLFPSRVQALQIGKGFRNFLEGNDNPIDTPTEDIAWALHDWQEKWMVLPHIPDDPAAASTFRDSKTVVARDINALFDAWSEERSVSFDERREKEAAAPGEIYEHWIDHFLSDNPVAQVYTPALRVARARVASRIDSRTVS